MTKAPAEGTGPLRPVSAVWTTLDFAQYQASDGLTTFIAVREDGGAFTDVVLRGGELRTNVLQGLAQADAHPGGCGGARDGIMLLSAPAAVPGKSQTVVEFSGNTRSERKEPQLAQSVWVVTPDGAVEELPRLSKREVADVILDRAAPHLPPVEG